MFRRSGGAELPTRWGLVTWLPFKLHTVFQSPEGSYQMQMGLHLGKETEGSLEAERVLLDRDSLGAPPWIPEAKAKARAGHAWARAGVFLMVGECSPPPPTHPFG